MLLSSQSFLVEAAARCWHERKPRASTIFFDNDTDGSPNVESVWAQRFLLLSGAAFPRGLLIGSSAAWVVVGVRLSLPVPLVSLLFTSLTRAGLCCLLIKCFDWAEVSWAGHELTFAREEEPEDDDKER